MKTPETVVYEIFREIIRITRSYAVQELMILACQDVVDLLMDEKHDALLELLSGVDNGVDVPVRFQVETLYTQEQFDVVMM